MAPRARRSKARLPPAATSSSISIFKARARFGNIIVRDVVTIFVLPPSFDELAGRLRRRGTEDEAAIERRLKRARDEASAYPEYNYLIINAEVGDSIGRLEAIVTAERLRVARLRDGFEPWKL